jgi:hypothetical protein
MMLHQLGDADLTIAPGDSSNSIVLADDGARRICGMLSLEPITLPLLREILLSAWKCWLSEQDSNLRPSG